MPTKSLLERAADSDDNADDLLAADGTSTITVEDAGAFDCGVCYLPFKPPIFQCIEGHAVCSPCGEKLMATGIAGHGYIRSHSLERMVESVRVPCPYAAHGCATRPVYYDQSTHRRTCPYAPRRCPIQPCDFIGPVGPLRQHLFGPHYDEAVGGTTLNVKRLVQLVIWSLELDKAHDEQTTLEQSVAVAEDGKEDSGGVLPRDVELIMQYAGVSRDKAIEALKESGGDIVRTIMGLPNLEQATS